MATKIVLSHRVKDYSQWRPGFDSDEARRAAAGIKVEGVYRSLDDENNVTIIGTVEDPAVMRQMFDNPEMQQIMEQAGVISKPEMMMMREA